MVVFLIFLFYGIVWASLLVVDSSPLKIWQNVVVNLPYSVLFFVKIIILISSYSRYLHSLYIIVLKFLVSTQRIWFHCDIFTNMSLYCICPSTTLPSSQSFTLVWSLTHKIVPPLAFMSQVYLITPYCLLSLDFTIFSHSTLSPIYMLLFLFS